MRRFVILPLASGSALLLLLLAGLIFILYTETGLKYLASYTTKFIPQLHLENPRGSALGKAQFSRLSWQQEGVTVEISDAKLVLSPLCFINLNLCAHNISADAVTITTLSQNNSDEPFALPEVSLPFDILIVSARINNLQINHNDNTVFIADKIKLKKFLWEKSTLSFTSLSTILWDEAIGAKIQAKGSITLSGDYPIKADIHAESKRMPDLSAYFSTSTSNSAAATSPQLNNAIKANVSGSLQQLHAKFTLQAPAVIDGTAALQPLDPQLPFSASLKLQQAVPVIIANERVLLNEARIALNGTIDTLNATSSGQLNLPFAIGPATIQAQLATDYSSLSIEHAELLTKYGAVNANGQLYFDDQHESELSIIAKAINPAFIEAQYQGKLNANAKITFKQLLSNPAIEVALSKLDGEFSGQALSSSGSITLNASQQLQFEHWALINNGSIININGSFPDGTISWSANINELKKYLPQASGQVIATGTLFGSLAQPSLTANINAATVAFADFQAKAIATNISINQLGWKPSKIIIDANTVTLPGIEQSIDANVFINTQQQADSGIIDPTALWQFAKALTANTKLSLRQGNIWKASLHCNTVVNVTDTSTTTQCDQALAAINKALLKAQPNKATVTTTTSQVSASTIDWSEWRNDKPINLLWQAQNKMLRIDSFCIQHSPSSICLKQNFSWQAGRTSDTQINGEKLPLAWLMAFTPSNYHISGDWDFNATLGEKPGADNKQSNKKQTNDHWQLDGNIAANNAAVLIGIDNSTQLDIAVEKMAVNFSADQQGANSSFSLLSDKLGDMRGNINYLQKTLQGKVILDNVDLHPFQFLLPSFKQLTGLLSSNLNFKLVDNKIDLLGKASLTKLAIQARDLPADISNGTLELNFLNQQAELTGQMQIGDGQADLTGTATWATDDWKAQLALQTSTIRIEPLPKSYLNVNSNLTLTASPSLLHIDGDVMIPKARIEVKKLPENAVGVSDDTVIDGQDLNHNKLQVSARIKAQLGDDIKFRGFGLETKVTGGLLIKQVPGQLLSGNGVVNLIDGRFRAYGQDLSIEEGRMVFSGPLTNPELLVTATRTHTEGNVRVGVLTTGPAKNPTITLFSSPTMPEQKTLYYLLTGKSPENDDDIDQSQLARQTAIALALAQSNDKANDIATSFGIEDFQMTTDVGKSGEEAQFSGYISPDIYVRYGVSLFDQLSSITARYKLTPNVYVEIYDSASSAIDIFWSVVKD